MDPIRLLKLGTLALSAAVLLGLAPAARERPSAPDIMKLSPQDLVGPPSPQLVQDARKAYRDGKYKEAAKLYAEIVRRRPGDAIGLYNMACCYALLGSQSQAARFLSASWDAGFRDLAQIDGDPDFDRVRESEAFKAAVEELRRDDARRRAQAGDLVGVPVRTVEPVSVILPADVKPGRVYPLVVGLHGSGANPDNFIPFFADTFRAKGFIFCVPQGQYARDVGEPGSLGYDWFLPPRRDPTALTRRLSQEYILSILEAVAQRYPVDPDNIFLVGFSQGARLTYSLILDHPGRFRGAIPIGGWLDADGLDTARAKETASGLRLLVCHSPEDRAVTTKESEESVAILKGLGCSPEVFAYSGGHAITPALADKVAGWIRSQVKPAGAKQ